MRRQILCVGTGGQGVIWLGRALGQAALAAGVKVISAETHGMAMRGGSVTCHVKLGAFASPVILPGRADLLLALDAGEAARNRYYLAEGGAVAIHIASPAVPGEVDALAIARAAGAPRGLNAALLGHACGRDLLGLPRETVRAAVAEVSPTPHREANLAAFDAGCEAATRR